jgi:carbon-monoxide dehydrogenase medium subunit
VRAAAAEAGVTGAQVSEIDADEVGRTAVTGLPAIPSDLHGSSAFRARVGATMATRAWVAAIEEAQGG